MATYADGLSIHVELTEFASQEMRKLGILADQAIVAATPFDTGRAKSNWLMSLGAPDESINESSISINGSYSTQLAASVLGNYPTDSLPDIWICNNLPYIARLNDGWSQQAPAKFVETAIEQAVSYGR